MKLILDTNRYRDFCAEQPEAVRVLQQAERIYLPFIVLAELRAGLQLRRQGTPIPAHDLWIAALAAQHGALLCTQDAHFQNLPQIPRV
jgi:predicted nucleic acid-binding protein